MVPGRRRLPIAFATVGLGACGLSVTGAGSKPEADAGVVVDASAPPPDVVDEPLPPVPESDGGDACAPIVLADDFTTDAAWLRSSEAKISDGVATLVTGHHASGQVFFTTPAPTGAFRASFRFQGTIAQQGIDLGDGFAFGWLDTGGDPARIGKEFMNGGGLGLPKGIAGFAFIFDAYRNPEIDDPPPPFYAFVTLDPMRGLPGNFAWWLTSTQPLPGAVFGAWHDVVVNSGGPLTTVTVDGVQHLSTPTPRAFTGHFGFTAGSGGAEVLVVRIDDFRLELPGCR